jgi:hypothetical protein
MAELVAFADGGYSFLKGGFPFSQGVAALPGFAIERVQLLKHLPLTEGFRLVEEHLKSVGRPRTALCAAELRSPQPFSFDGFGDFNKGYVAVLEEWRIFRDGVNPVARSNVAPVGSPPSEPGFYAFSYTVPAEGRAPDYVVAGSAERREGGRFPEDIVARGDTSAAGLKQKCRLVIATMRARLEGLRVSAAQAGVVQVYTAHDLHPLMGDVEALAPQASVTWHRCRPPIEGLEFEMDLRAVSAERSARA